MRRALSAFCAVVALAAVGCPSSKDSKPDAGPVGLRIADASASAPDAEAEDEVKPVYDVNVAPDPLAKKFCASLSDVLEERRAACCKTTPSVVVTDECVRNLSGALATKAVTLAAADVDTCIAALEKRFDGCDWVGPFPPGPPDECTNLLKGTVADGGRCRSNLECAAGMRCHGLTPTRAGKCGAPKQVGQPCGGAVDPLAGFARQNFDTSHPECKEHCIQHQCAMPGLEGSNCSITTDCTDGMQCLSRKCTKSAPAKLGDACPGGGCEAPGECILGKCAVKKNAGEPCSLDFECKGGCVRGDAGTKGKCGMRCDIR